jgi:hypothetical protein
MLNLSGRSKAGKGKRLSSLLVLSSLVQQEY